MLLHTYGETEHREREETDDGEELLRDLSEK